jgi:hypothetical protein
MTLKQVTHTMHSTGEFRTMCIQLGVLPSLNKHQMVKRLNQYYLANNIQE